jgi:dipeptidyl aminopeptidase/acylaminoacyl peptidase
MGGGISTRAITVDPDIKAAVLYGAMSGDEEQNFRKILEWSDGQRGQEELQVPPEALARISPIHHLDRIEAAVSVHHGESDELVPEDWSIDLCQRLSAIGKTVECFTYPGQPHTFYGEGDQLFIRRMIAFFDRHLIR